VVVQ